MFVRAVRSFLALLAITLLSTAARAQAVPTPAQAQQMLQNNPALIARLQQMIQSSGMTPDQIRARLRAQGYPDALLDQYLPGASQGDSTAVPSTDVFAAVRALGLGDSLVVDSLSKTAKTRRQEQ